MRNKSKTVFLIVVTVILVFVLSSALVLAEETQDETEQPVNQSSETVDPDYKLQSNILQQFRPNWVWNEEEQEYDNICDLVRDPETGLFPEPNPSPKDLEGYAYWDPYLGLYVINSIQINHETGEIVEKPFEGYVSTKKDWPIYTLSEDDSFDTKYLEYRDFVNEKYVNESSRAYAELDIIEQEGFTEQWFELGILDLPMLLDKLEAGAPPSYTMSMILLVTKADVGFNPSRGAEYNLYKWLDNFNVLSENAVSLVENGDHEKLGYLALPIIYDQIKAGNEEMIMSLPEIAEGLYDCQKTEAENWSRQQWIDWFELNSEIIDTIQDTLDRQINMSWLY